MPAMYKRGLVKALVLVGSAQEDAASRDNYWNQVGIETHSEAGYLKIWFFYST